MSRTSVSAGWPASVRSAVVNSARVDRSLSPVSLMPSAVGIVAQEFPQTRARMVGLFMSIFPVGGIIGPNLGGFIVEHWSWRECFFINLPLGLIVILVLLRRARQTEPTKRRRIAPL